VNWGLERMEANPPIPWKTLQGRKEASFSGSYLDNSPERIEQASFKGDSWAGKDVIRRAYPHIDWLKI
jgi:hypothetical protein